jgi:outer membrane protein assembly factor BamC
LIFEEPLVNNSPRLSRPGLSAIALSLALSACSVLESDRIDYKSAGKAPSLEVPPDLTQLSKDTRYNVPGGSVSASDFQVGKAPAAMGTAATSLGDVRIERLGNQRWLVVNRPADQLWDTVKDFWQDNGFLLTQNQANLGIMETDWAENRAKLPQDFIRNSIGKVFDALYSTGERDKFRTRLERTAVGATEIYISHRGMVETFGNTSQTERTVWTPRAADPELETEFLRRLMVRLGAAPETAKAVVAESVKTTSKVATVNGQPVVQIDEGFERAWRRVGLSLDRTGFTVEDRDRAKGTYFVRYVEPTADKSEPGFFAKLFSSTPTAAPLKYRITVQSQGEASTVAILNAEGGAESSANAQRILKIIADDLR